MISFKDIFYYLYFFAIENGWKWDSISNHKILGIYKSSKIEENEINVEQK